MHMPCPHTQLHTPAQPSFLLGSSGAPSPTGEAVSEGGAEAASTPIPPEDIAAEVQAAVDAVKGAKPVGSDLCLDAVRRLRQLLSNYDEPPFKEAVQGGWRWYCFCCCCAFAQSPGSCYLQGAAAAAAHG